MIEVAERNVSNESSQNGSKNPGNEPKRKASDDDGRKEEESEQTQRINQHDEPVGVTPGAKAGTDSSDDRPEEEEEGGCEQRRCS